MTFITVFEEARIHQEVYTTAFKSALKEVGSKRQFAHRLGITPVYLSYVLSGVRSPSPVLAKKMVQLLFPDQALAHNILDHIRLGRERELQKRAVLRDPSLVKQRLEHIGELQRLLHQATFVDEPSQAKTLYLQVRDSGTLLARHLSPRLHTEEFVELCFILHDTLSVMGWHHDALYYANLVYEMLKEQEVTEFQTVNFARALRAKSIAYRNMRLFDQAYTACQEALALKDVRQRPLIYAPHIHTDTLSTLAGMTRFAVSEAENLADQAISYCERRGGDIEELWILMVRRGLSNAYIKYNNLKKASIVCQQIETQMRSVPSLGPLRQTMLLVAQAKVYWRQEDKEAWDHTMRQALTIARDAGLVDQVRKMQRTYGVALQPVSVELGIDTITEAA